MTPPDEERDFREDEPQLPRVGQEYALVTEDNATIFATLIDPPTTVWFLRLMLQHKSHQEICCVYRDGKFYVVHDDPANG